MFANRPIPPVGPGPSVFNRGVGFPTPASWPVRPPIGRSSVIDQPPFITPATAINFEVHFETGTPSLPSQMSLSRTTAATRWNSSGVLVSEAANTARFDYDPKTLALKGLLVESAMDNNSWSSDWVNSWLPSSATATNVADPMGGTLAKKLVPDNVTAWRHEIAFGTIAITTANPTTHSVYATAAGFAQCGLRDERTGSFAVYNLSGSGSVAGTHNGGGTPSATVIASGIIDCGNGLYRCWFTQTVTASCDHGIACYVLDGNWTSTSGDIESTYWWTGNGTSGVTFFGTQIEQSSNPPTSYIPTAGASITRGADIISSTDATWRSSNGYVMEVGELAASTAATLFGFDAAVGLGFDSTNHLTTAAGGTQTSGNTGTLTGTTRGGIAFDGTPRVSIDLNGGTVVTAANSISDPSTIYFGNTNNGAGGFLNGHIRSLAGYTSLTDDDMPTFTAVGASYTPVTAANLTYAAALGALVQAATATVTDTAVSDQTLGPLGQAATAAVSIAAAVDQTLGPLGQTATATAPPALNAVVAQTLGALGQTATAAVKDALVAAQTLAATTQAATATATDTIAASHALGALNETATAAARVAAVVAQTLGALGQAAAAAAIDTATVNQNLGALQQLATAAAIDAAVASQSLGPLGQAAAMVHAPATAVYNSSLGALGQAATVTVNVAAAVSQALGALGQALTAAATDIATTAQTLPATAQTATGAAIDTAAVAQTLGNLAQAATAVAKDAATAAQTLGAIAQAAAATVTDTATVNQTLGALQQVLFSSQQARLTADQTLPAFTQAAAGVVLDRAVAAQTLAGLVQVLTGVAIDSAVVTQALGQLGQAAAAVHVSGASVDQVLPSLGQGAAGTAEVRATVSQVLGTLAQLAQATTDRSAHIAANQIIGMLQQIAAARVQNSAAANQILGVLGQAAIGRQARIPHTYIKGSLAGLLKSSGPFVSAPHIRGSLAGTRHIKGRLS